MKKVKVYVNNTSESLDDKPANSELKTKPEAVSTDAYTEKNEYLKELEPLIDEGKLSEIDCCFLTPVEYNNLKRDMKRILGISMTIEQSVHSIKLHDNKKAAYLFFSQGFEGMLYFLNKETCSEHGGLAMDFLHALLLERKLTIKEIDHLFCQSWQREDKDIEILRTISEKDLVCYSTTMADMSLPIMSIERNRALIRLYTPDNVKTIFDNIYIVTCFMPLIQANKLSIEECVSEHFRDHESTYYSKNMEKILGLDWSAKECRLEMYKENAKAVQYEMRYGMHYFLNTIYKTLPHMSNDSYKERINLLLLLLLEKKLTLQKAIELIPSHLDKFKNSLQLVSPGAFDYYITAIKIRPSFITCDQALIDDLDIISDEDMNQLFQKKSSIAACLKDIKGRPNQSFWHFGIFFGSRGVQSERVRGNETKFEMG